MKKAINNIKINFGGAVYYWDGRSFDTLDFSDSVSGSADPLNYHFEESELESELKSAKDYANEKYENGDFCVGGDRVYVSTSHYDFA